MGCIYCIIIGIIELELTWPRLYKKRSGLLPNLNLFLVIIFESSSSNISFCYILSIFLLLFIQNLSPYRQQRKYRLLNKPDEDY